MKEERKEDEFFCYIIEGERGYGMTAYRSKLIEKYIKGQKR
jgi:hypothetical protein